MLMDRISTLPLTPPGVVASGSSVQHLVDVVRNRNVGCVLVYEGSRLKGIITERDVLLKVVARDVDYSSAVDDFMTPDPVTLTPEHTLGDAANLMTQHDFRHIPIVDRNGNAIGVVSIKDIINLIAESFPEQVLNLPPRPHQKMETPEGG